MPMPKEYQPGGHDFDLTAARQLLADPEVAAWIKAGSAAVMLPAKRS